MSIDTVTKKKEPVKYEPLETEGSMEGRLELEVNCHAMQEAGIDYGDHIKVIRTNKCSEGQIVIALLNGQMLLRKFHRNGLNVQLVPATPGLAAIEVDTRACDFHIWGVVTHVIKKV